MPLRPWRRFHGPDLIAQVHPIGGFGTWEASTWCTKAPKQVTRVERSLELLTDAQRAADDLVAATFDHECSDGVCGPWLPRAG